MKISKTDWANHFVAFLSALIGIFIAFQLQDWQERRTENEKLKIAMSAIRVEIEGNLKIYMEDSVALSSWFDYATFLWVHHEKLVSRFQLNYNKIFPGGAMLLATENEMKSIVAKQPARMSEFKVVKKLNDSLNVYGPIVWMFDTNPQIGISTEAWEAARSLGILANLDYQTLALLTNIYQVTDEDLGVNQTDIKKELLLKSNILSEAKIEMFGDLALIYAYKGHRIGKYYKLINWKSD